jgi:hypothetical protein
MYDAINRYWSRFRKDKMYSNISKSWIGERGFMTLGGGSLDGKNKAGNFLSSNESSSQLPDVVPVLVEVAVVHTCALCCILEV